MSLTEFNEEEFVRNRLNEGRAEGEAKDLKSVVYGKIVNVCGGVGGRREIKK